MVETLHVVFLNLACFQPKWLSRDCSDATFVFVSSENPILYSNVFFSIFLYKINFCQVGDDVFVNRTLTWQPISPPSVRPLFTFHQSWGCLIDQTVRRDQAEAQTPHCGGHSQWGCGTCDTLDSQWPSTTAVRSIWRRTQDHPGPGLCSDSFWPWQPSVGLIEIGLCDMGGWSLYFKCWALFSDVFKMPSCQLGWHLYLAVLGSICPVFKQIPSQYASEFNNWAFNLSKVE